MWRHWSTPDLKVICACFTPTGIHYLHSCSLEAPATTGGVDGKSTSQSASDISISILHGSLTKGGCSVRIIIRSLETSSSSAQAAVAVASGRPCLPFKSRVPQHWRLKGAISGERTNQNVTVLTITTLVKGSLEDSLLQEGDCPPKKNNITRFSRSPKTT